MELRPYQQEAYDNTLAAWAVGKRRVLAVAATGTGKTVLFGHLAKHVVGQGQRVMVLAHRDELVRQAAAKVARVTGITPEIEKAGERASEDSMHGRCPVVVSSIQTQYSGDAMWRRMQRFNPAEFGLLVTDEAHHAPAATWRAVIEHYLGNPACRLFGCTATPDRSDETNLGTVFEHVACDYQLHHAVRDGYLVPIRQRSVVIEGIDFSKVATRRTPDGGRDFVESELEAVMSAERPVHQVVSAAIELSYGLERGALRPLLELDDDGARRDRLRGMLAGRRHRRALVFCVGVAHATLTADVLNRWLGASGELGDLADSVDGKTPPELRKQKIKAFGSGERPFLTNCMIATEGFDEPRVEVVVVARPTKSRSLFAQILGRGTRPWPDIADALGGLPGAAARAAAIAASEKPRVDVLDFTDNSRRHDLVTAVKLIAPGADALVIERAEEIAAEGDVDAGEAVAQAEEEVELTREANRLVAERAAEEMDAAEDAAAVSRMPEWRRSLVGAADYEVSEANTGGNVSAGREGGATDAQIGLLVKLGCRRETAMGYGKRQASAVIESLKAKRCTTGQAGYLRRLGYSAAEVEGMNFDQASAAIERAKGDAA